jgi:Peptidase family M28
MARTTVLAFAPVSFLLAVLGGGEPSAPVRKGLESITANDAKIHVDYLASPALEGRNTGEKGCEAAAEYLANQLKHFGIEPFGDVVDGKTSYFQRYPITSSSLEASSELTIETEKGPRSLKLAKDFAPLGASIPHSADASPIVDGGTIEIPARDRSAPRTQLEIKFPAEAADAFVLVHVSGLTGGGRNWTLATALFGACEAAKARGVLIVPASGQNAEAWDKSFSAAAASATTARLEYGSAESIATRPLARSNRPFLLLRNADLAAGIAGGKAAFRAVSKREEKKPANVVGIVRGSDPQLASEHVVFSAHYDHVGFEGGDLHPGADDNASGTAAVLEIAQALASTEAPRRSAIVLWVSGEEKGLWGSRWFSDHPPVPIQSLVADLNIDMVGRSSIRGEEKPGYMEMTPSKKSEFFNTLAAEAIELGPQYGFAELTNGDKYWQRSDHYNFAKHGVPTMFLCNGEHEDYHQPGDTPDKVDAEKISRSAKLCFQLGYETAMRDERPKILGKAAR